MNINTRELGFVNFNGEEMNFIKYNGVVVYEAWKKLLASGIPPLTLLKCKQANLVDYKVYGESVQQNKNKFDGKLEIGSINNNGVNVTSSANIRSANYISVLPNTTYTLSTPTGNLALRFYDANQSFLSAVASTSSPLTFTAPSNAEYMRFVNTNNTDINANIQLEIGDTATEYISPLPTPDTPIEIESVGDKTNNLFNQATTKTASFSSAINTSVREFEEGVWYRGLTYNNYSYPTNLLDYSFENYTTMIIVNGQKAYGLAQAFKTEPNKTYIFNYDGSPEGRVGFGFYDKDGNFLTYAIWTKGMSIKTPDNTYWMTICLSGTVANVEINFSNIQLILGETLLTYEPYGYKIPVKVSGKNKFDMNGKIIQNYQTDISIDGNTIIATSTSTGNYVNSKIKIPDIEAGTTVTLSAEEISASNTNKARIFLAYYDASTNTTTTFKNLDNGGSITVTIPEKTSDNQELCLLFYSNVNGTNAVGYYCTYKNVQLEIGDTATEYEPYVEPIVVRGKNLINTNNSQVNKYINSSGVVGSSSGYGLSITENIYVKPSTTYVYSGMGNVNGSTVMRTGYQYDKSGNPLKAIKVSSGEAVSFTTEPNCAYVVLQYIKTEEKPMLEEGNVATSYEPYKETFPTIYLNEPLRKLGDYADYIDFEKGKVVRKVKEIITNGNENWLLGSGGDQLTNCYNLKITDIVNNEINTGLLLYSTHFTGSDKWQSTYDRARLIIAFNKYIGIGYSGIEDKIGSTVDDFKTWLNNQYGNGTPLKIYYPLQKQEEETIELPNITTIKGTTIIEVDTTIQPSNMEVVYLGKK